jgi:plasmid stabilization system protein ParE
MRVAWTRSAIADLAGIYEYIAKDSPRYALTVIDRLTKRTEQITTSSAKIRRSCDDSLCLLCQVLEGYRLQRLDDDSIRV